MILEIFKVLVVIILKFEVLEKFVVIFKFEIIIKRYGIVFVSIDSFYYVVAGKENNETVVRK